MNNNHLYESMGTKPCTLTLTAAQAGLLDDRIEIDLDSGEDFVGPWFENEAQAAYGSWCKRTKKITITKRLAHVLWEDVYYYTDFDMESGHRSMAIRLLDKLEAATPDTVKRFHERMRGA